MQNAMQHLAAHGSITGFESQLMMFAERQAALNADHYKELEKRYT
jgi:hypothetical protein